MNNARKKKLPPKVENMTKEELVVFLKKKRESEATAQKVVVSLLDSGITDADFLSYLPYINQSHYEDVTEERAISKSCGYPLCIKTLSDNLPSQQYKISLKTNRVFDITARKNFCSNSCYKASNFIKEQILTSPLWCREIEDIPKFKLLTHDSVGVLGEEVDLSLVKKVEVPDVKSNGFNSFLDFTEASLTEMFYDKDGKKITVESIEISDQKGHVSQTYPDDKSDICGDATDIYHLPEKSEDTNLATELIDNEGSHQLSTLLEINSDTESLAVENSEHEGESINIIDKHTTKNKALINTLKKENEKTKDRKSKSNKIIGDVIERKAENKIDPFISGGEKLQVEKRQESSKRIAEVESRNKTVKNDKAEKVRNKKGKQPISIIIVHVEKCMGEWFTIETMLFLFGDERVKRMVTDKGDCIKEYLNNMANGLLYKSTSYDQYQQLCRKLNLLELEDRRYDGNVNTNKELKPLPHYSMLQEESKSLEIKVRAFYKGEMQVPTNNTKPEEDKRDEENDDQSVTNLPLVDKTAQHALRRKIVLNSLNRVLPDLSQTLGVLPTDIKSDVRILVATFNLQAHNIIFKPIQWHLIAMVVVKLLSIRDRQLKKCLEAERANKHLQLLLMSYDQDGGYLDRLISWLTDVDRLLDSTNTQLTVRY